MRVVRTAGACLAWLVATVLLVLAVVVSLTLVLLPVGLLLGYVAVRLYRLGLRLALPRARDVKKGVEKEARRWRRQLTPRRRRRWWRRG
ncbi:hypothetical protein [Pseudonocardia adelaidensis]|uniref:Transmembrane protein PGPGW n=1 Tax=Pseudonocardia adelaidensis TaxID=648754 RepID=A0ABP9P027_9PSEU